ncbi:TetR family transcriptional regulator [Fervidicella metallireducens AeB]|uniref:TetR family transcriptional regulator n=1 Tax=Fervidicella metallireducens AeB TaxID=1403537 RepID=A0A017RYY2_9CLOT|nr:TetR/AcrR family transcriptional regulator [Fervidicella metallireducens]EYE89130.1 TetR family transcriptional regulator [Fervidicella metallireducens AeB]
MSNKKEIQRKRIMKFFIDAAKEIIKEEGVKGLTARKIGDRAGHSYATIYNYFSDIKELLAYCVFDFLEDCYQYMIGFKNENLNCIDQIIVYTDAYFKYFIEKPDMFQLIFIEDLGNIPIELLKREKKLSIGVLLKECICRCAEEGYIEKENIDVIYNLLGSSIHGKLVFLVNKRDVKSADDMLLELKSEIEFLMKIKR